MGDAKMEKENLEHEIKNVIAKSNQTNVTLTQFDRVVQRERVALARLREEIAKDVTLWTEIMEGRLDNRNAAHILELAVSSYEAPHRWREWGGDWILASEMNEFLELLKERQLYWKNSFVQNERKVWWGALSRPASLLGVVVFDSGHSFELGGLGDVVGRVFGHDQGIDGGEDLLEEGAVVVTDVWLIGCHIVDGHIVDGGGSSGRVKAPDIVLRRRHIDDIENEDDIKIPCYAHRGSSVLLSIPLRQAHVGEDRKEKAFWSLRGVKLLVQ